MKRELLIGSTVGAAAPEQVRLDADVLTTHGVILGMTGSGKTGLAIVLLEELARHRVPLVICDLKGDLTNLLLTFPGLTAAEFAPVLPAGDAAGDRAAAAEKVAAKWREGLAKWGLGEADIRALREALDWRLLTPGSGLAPVDLLPALEAPEGYDPDIDPDGARIKLDGTAAGLLAMVDRGGDPLSDRDHVLVATLLDAAWRAGTRLDLAELIRQIAEPPVARFGVLDAEGFYPRKERQDLVLAFNTVLASPAFAAWTRGAPLAMPELIGPAEKPRGTILYLAHLADRERLSFLTLLFSTVLAWTRAQPGSDSLRALLYLDEVQGILPPTAMPPTKPPLLTLLKQGRAFGTGVLLATQNPVDLDYKALGNIGLKLVGRLDTENDRRRALEGLDVGGSDVEATAAALKPREFLLAGARVGAPRTITSRWAMSYLRGPLTLAELKPLLAARGVAPAPPPVRAAAGTTTAAPLLAGIDQLFAAGARLDPHVLVEAEVVVRKASPSLERRLGRQWLAPLAAGRVAWDRLSAHDLLDLDAAPAPGATLGELPGNAEALLRAAAREFAREVDSQAIEVLFHRRLRLVQDEGESRAEFEARCRGLADPADGQKEAAIRRRFEDKLRRVDERVGKKQAEVARHEQETAAREREKTLAVAAGVGDTLLSGLGALFGRRRSIGAAMRKGASAAKTYGAKDRMADQAAARVEQARQEIAQLEQEKSRLADELEQELAALRQRAGDDAAAVEVLRLTPAAKDISVRRVALAWLPGDEAP